MNGKGKIFTAHHIINIMYTPTCSSMAYTNKGTL